MQPVSQCVPGWAERKVARWEGCKVDRDERDGKRRGRCLCYLSPSCVCVYWVRLRRLPLVMDGILPPMGPLLSTYPTSVPYTATGATGYYRYPRDRPWVPFPSHPMPPTPRPGLASTYPVQLHIARTALLPALQFQPSPPMEARQATRRPLRQNEGEEPGVIHGSQLLHPRPFPEVSAPPGGGVC